MQCYLRIGSQQRKWRDVDQLIQSQKGILDMFFPAPSSVMSNDNVVQEQEQQQVGENLNEVDVSNDDANLEN